MDIVSKYKANYKLEIPITEEMIFHHWNLERKLTEELLSSTPLNRWQTFERCYERLYSELPWLNTPARPDPVSYRVWAHLIGETPNKIYEIGSGQGGLIRYLANIGHQCKATEITRERGKRFDPAAKIFWDTSDGVHLDKFEPPESFDVCISDNVIEHLHPDDLVDHFKGVRSILVSSGRYIFRTPHAYIGPSDVSRIFGCDSPQGMHLKEYTYAEIRSALKSADFSKVCAIWNLPRRINNKYCIINPIESTLFLSYFCRLEKLIAMLPKKHRRRASILLMAMQFNPDIFIIAQK